MKISLYCAPNSWVSTGRSDAGSDIMDYCHADEESFQLRVRALKSFTCVNSSNFLLPAAALLKRHYTYYHMRTNGHELHP